MLEWVENITKLLVKKVYAILAILAEFNKNGFSLRGIDVPEWM